MVKVICAGPPKTGTKSMARALRILGYNEVYDYEEALEFAFDEWEAVWNGSQTDIMEVLQSRYSENVEAVVDLPHSHFFEEFLKLWPDAKVILMTREEEKWFASFKGMLDAAERDHRWLGFLVYFIPASKRVKSYHCNQFSTVLGSKEPNPLKWKMWFRRHNAYVKSVVPPKQLLTYNVSEGWGPLCQFLDKAAPSEEFPFENKAGSKGSIVERVIEDTRIVKQVKFQATVFFAVVPIVIIAFLWWLFF